MEELKKILDDFYKSVSAGDMDQSLKIRTAAVKKSILDEIQSPEDKAGIMQMMQSMVPLFSTCEHLDQKDNKAMLYLTAQFKNPEKPTETVTQELKVDFANEEGVWKMGDFTYMFGGGVIKRAPDQNYEPESSYDAGRDVSVGGRIVSVKLENDYTLVVIRMLDEEDLIFLPKKEELTKMGLDIAKLLPWNTLSVSGHPHKTNTFKIWGSKAEILEPEYNF